MHKMIIFLSITLVLLSAIFSGLNLGLMSLRPSDLKRKAAHGDKAAAKIYPVRKNGNLLLVSLLTGNVATISALSLVLDTKLEGLIAGLLTTALITMFGEILPQAIFSRHALKLGVYFVWLVKILLVLMWPVAAPIAYVLDKALGDELPQLYGKAELAQMIKEHGAHEASEIDKDEVRIATGALTFSNKTISRIMTPKENVKTVRADTIVDYEKINELKESGHSRFPVTQKGNVVGILYAKDLINIADFQQPAEKLMRKKTLTIARSTKLDDALDAFIKKRRHIFIVTSKSGAFVGIVTLEDVIEEILNKEIVDEHDKIVDMRKVH